MPLPFALLFGLVIGLLFATVARAELVHYDGPLVQTRGLLVAASYGAFVLAPVAAYFVAFHGDWAYLYVWPWARVPSALDLLFVLAVLGSVPAGFLLSASLGRTGKGAALRILITGALAALLLAALVLGRRLGVSATYAQYHGGFGGERLVGSSLGRGVLWMDALLAVGVGLGVRAIMRGPEEG